MIRIILLIAPLGVLAQPDSSRGQQSVDITSSFKPNMYRVGKINFSASQLKGDTARNLRPYEVPGQNLFYSYRPIALKPLALESQADMELGTRNFVKAGVGNYATPYLRAGLAYGDAVDYLGNAYLDYTSSNGSQKFQDFSRFQFKAAGSRFFQGYEWYGAAGFRRDNYFLYGYDQQQFPDVKKEDVQNRQQEFSISTGFRNTEPGERSIRYNPEIKYSLFSMKEKVTESALFFNLPFEKNFSDKFSAKLELNSSLIRITQKFTDTATGQRFDAASNNNLLRISPSVTYSIKPFIFKAGVSPVWNRGELTWLPDVTIDADLFSKFSLQTGWVGRIVQNSSRYISSLNPYFDPQVFLPNTKESEFFAGIKGGIGKHFSFSGKAGWVAYKNVLFFVNDTAAAGRGMILYNEKAAGNLRITGSISYIDKDKFSLKGNIILNGYTNVDDYANARPWHTLPIEISGAVRWHPFKKLTLTSDIWTFSGGRYLARANREDYKLGSGLDLSTGAEYAFSKKISGWLTANNLLNNKYQRWHDYPVYGINFLGGVLIRF